MAPVLRDSAHHRQKYYDIEHDIYWWQVTQQEIDLIAADRAQRGLVPLEFLTYPYAAMQFTTLATLLQAFQTLRETLGMAGDAGSKPPLEAVLQEAVRRLQGQAP